MSGENLVIREWKVALEKIDKGGKVLPAGKMIVKSGGIVKFTSGEKSVMAIVQGSESNPFRTELSIKTLAPVHKQRLKKILENNPMFSVALMQKELPRALVLEMEKEEIRFLPGSWKDFEINCTCAESVPCRHAAAVLEYFPSAMQQDPYLLFRMRGLDLEEMARKSARDLDMNVEMTVAPEEDSFMDFDPVPDFDASFRNASPPLELALFPVKRILSAMKMPTTLGQQADITPLLSALYTTLAQEVKQLVPLSVDDSAQLGRLELYFAQLNEEGSLDIIPWVANPEILSEMGYRELSPEEGSQLELLARSEDQESYELCSISGEALGVSELIHIIEQLPILNQPESSVMMRFLSRAINLIQAAVAAGAFIPQIRPTSGTSFCIRYELLHADPALSAAYQHLQETMPYNLVYREPDCAILSRNGLDDFMSWLLGHFISSHTESLHSFEGIHPMLREAFLTGEEFQASKLEEELIGPALTQILQAFNDLNDGYAPVFNIVNSATDNHHFDLKIGVAYSTKNHIQRSNTYSDKVMQRLRREARYQKKKEAPLTDILKNRGGAISTAMAKEIYTSIQNRLSLLGIYISSLPKAIAEGQAQITDEDLAVIMDARRGELQALGIIVREGENIPTLTFPEIAWLADTADEDDDETPKGAVIALSYELFHKGTVMSLSKMENMLKERHLKEIYLQDTFLVITERMRHEVVEKLGLPTMYLDDLDAIKVLLSNTYEGTKVIPSEYATRWLQNLIKPEPDIAQPRGKRFSGALKSAYEFCMHHTGLGTPAILIENQQDQTCIKAIAATLLAQFEQRRYAGRASIVITESRAVADIFQQVLEGNESGLRVQIATEQHLDTDLPQMDVIVLPQPLLSRLATKLAAQRYDVLAVYGTEILHSLYSADIKALRNMFADGHIIVTTEEVRTNYTLQWNAFDLCVSDILGSSDAFLSEYITPWEKFNLRKEYDHLMGHISAFIMRVE